MIKKGRKQGNGRDHMQERDWQILEDYIAVDDKGQGTVVEHHQIIFIIPAHGKE